MRFDNNYPFLDYVQKYKSDLTKLEHLTLPKPIVLTITNAFLEEISKNKTFNWEQISGYKDLERISSQPVVYYFTINENLSRQFFDSFVAA
jgi:hypothetical protein